MEVTTGAPPFPFDATAVILAGGASSRMGKDKSLLDIGGIPLIERVLGQLRGRFREVLISAEEPEPFRFTKVPVIADLVPGQGPLMGIAGALEAATSDTVFVVACDIPDIDHSVVRRLLSAAGEADCAVPRRADGKWEPLYSVWRRSALPAVREVLSSGRRKIDAAFPLLTLAIVDIGEAPWLRNLNTPEDVAKYLSSRDANV
jgi:molybdenum cofactor guanylyltransferase